MAKAKILATGMVVAITAILTTTGHSVWKGTQTPPGVDEVIANITAGKKSEVTPQELIQKIKKLGAIGVVFYDGDLLFTPEKYDKEKRYSEIDTLVWVRINDEKTQQMILEALGRGRKLSGGEAKYFSLI